MSYDGNEDATHERVRRYLKENYVDTDDTPLSEARLTELLADHSLPAGRRMTGSCRTFWSSPTSTARP